MKKGIIVLGGHVQGLGIIRIFGKNNISCILLDNNKINIARHSKYCNSFYKYDEDCLLNFLLELGKSNKYTDWLLMPTNDLQVKTLSQNKKELEKYFKVSSDNWQNVETFYNKRITYKLAKDIGIDIPQTWFPNSISDVIELNLPFPCIIKPAVVQNFYKKAKKKVFVCNNKNELIDNYKKAVNIIHNNEIIVQEIIPGSSENQFSACFIFNRNKPLVQFVAKRKRQHPIDFGNATTYAETVNNNELLTIAEKILKQVKYNGICEVEFKFDERDRKYKFLEVNPRTWKWHAISEKSFSPFLMSLYNLIYNNKPTAKLTWSNAAFQHLTTDLPIIFELFLKGGFKKSEIKNIQYAVWDIKDLKPAFFELLYLPYLIIKR